MDSSATLSDSVLEIPLSEIAVIARQRKKLDPKLVQELADDIAENGLLHPIVVRRPFPEEPDVAGHPYVLCVGGRRFAAHAFLHRATIRATLRDDMDPLQAKIAELSENIKRVDITWDEKLAAEASIHELRILQNPSHKLSDTAEELSVDIGNLSRDLALHEAMKADPSLRDAKSAHSARRVLVQRKELNQRIATASKNTQASDAISACIHTADMRTFVRSLPDASIDLCFTDFPFGINYDQLNQATTNQGLYRDDPEQLRDLLTDVIPEIVRVVKPAGWIACMMGPTHYEFLATLFRDTCKVHYGYRIPETRHKCTKHTAGSSCDFATPEEIPWVWYRPNSRMPSLWPELHANNQYELFCVVNGGAAKLATPNVGNVLVYDQVYSDRFHTMQRPHELCKEVIRRFTVVGETVLDLCFGSGAHLAAAADSGRRFIGCDINPDNRSRAITLISEYYSKPVAEALRGAQEKAE